MPLKPLPGFIGPTYALPSATVDTERCINWFPERADGGATAKSPMYYYPTPGLQQFANLLTGVGVSSLYTFNGRSFAVSNNQIFEFFADGTSVYRGSTDSPPVGIACNGNQLCIICTSTHGYIYDLTANTLSFITASGFLPGGGVCQIDGYFIAWQPNSTVFFISSYKDGTSWDPLDFANSNGPEKLTGIYASHRQLWLFSLNHIEVWYDSGAALFPFSRIEGAYIEQGTEVEASIVQADNSLFWLGHDALGSRIIYRTNGYNGSRISNFAVETALQGYSTVSDMFAFVYQQNGHTFLVLSFPTGNQTWVYDIATQLWHEWAYWNPIDQMYFPARAICYTFNFGLHLVGDSFPTGNILQLSTNFTNDLGNGIRRLRRSPHIYQAGQRLFYNNFRLDMQTATDADLMLRWSDDGGNTWSNEIVKNTGGTGVYKRLIEWRRLGQGRDRVFELATISSTANAVLMEAYVDAYEGQS